MRFSPDFLVGYSIDSSKSLVTVIAEGDVEHQRYLAGSSPEDYVTTGRAVGTICITLLPEYSRKGVSAGMHSIEDWEVM